MPEERLGFVILTNSHQTPLITPGTEIRGAAEDIIWSHLLGDQPPDGVSIPSNSSSATTALPAGEQYKELVGTYAAEVQGRRQTFRLALLDDKLVVIRAGQSHAGARGKK